MSRNGKVIVAMSGGVDSSVAACLLKDQGYDCIGVFMRVGVEHEAPPTECSRDPLADASGSAAATPVKPSSHRHGCCSAGDALDARAIAGRLGIPFYALNFQADFDRIIDYFVDEYRQARTPNPCVMCNIHLKFGKLLRYADMMDAEFVATGHYARIVRDGPAAAPRLARAANHAKDQSYVLFGIQRKDLGRCLFPIGEIDDKAEVRRMASDLGLRVHDKPDSQEICFVPDNDYRKLIVQRSPELLTAGQLRHSDGRLLGRHEGVAAYTIGQRRGLGLAVGLPVYVTDLDARTNTVTVGPKAELLNRGLLAGDMNWHIDAPPVGSTMAAAVRIRHTHVPAPGRLHIAAVHTVEAIFDEPQSAVTPGQAVVFYDGDLVVGGGWIRAALSQRQEHLG